MIGVNSRIVREFNPGGAVSAEEVDLIELSLADFDFLRNGVVRKALELKELYDVNYTIHAPFQNSPVEHLRVKLSEIRKENIDVMKKVFDVCEVLEAEKVVVHAGDVANSIEKSLKNVVRNLRELCRIGRDFEVVLENLYTENGVRRVCETPDEILFVVDNASVENLSVNLDVGHAYLVHRQTNIPLECFAELRDYVTHMHVHNNFGVRDEHNPLNRGLIDLKVFKCRADTKILEIKNGTREEVLSSMSIIS